MTYFYLDLTTSLESKSPIIFRQPTRKQQLLDLAWGRLRLYMEIGQHEGVAIILEAAPRSGYVRAFTGKRSVGEQAELERFRAAGQIAVETK
jgi:hypothetical protein